MDEEAQKRNTDCVYFLASPLTCKKGNSCEFRHSKAARLNPRDCWYWVHKTCLNPNCAFRHPPIEGKSTSLPPPQAQGVVTDSPTVLATSVAPLPPAASLNKSKTPCYFFSQGNCAKGDKCSYMHGQSIPMSQESTKPPPVEAVQVSSKPVIVLKGDSKKQTAHESSVNRPVHRDESLPIPPLKSVVMPAKEAPQMPKDVERARNQESSVTPIVSRHEQESGASRKSRISKFSDTPEEYRDAVDSLRGMHGLAERSRRDQVAWKRQQESHHEREESPRRGVFNQRDQNPTRLEPWSKNEASMVDGEGSDGYNQREDGEYYPRFDSKGRSIGPDDSSGLGYKPLPAQHGSNRYKQHREHSTHQLPEYNGNAEHPRHLSFPSHSRNIIRDEERIVPEGCRSTVDLRNHLKKRLRVGHPTDTHIKERLWPDDHSQQEHNSRATSRREADYRGVKRQRHEGSRIGPDGPSHWPSPVLGHTPGRSPDRVSSFHSPNRHDYVRGEAIDRGREWYASRMVLDSDSRSHVTRKGVRSEYAKDDSDFSGPKSLAQIKAEKMGEGAGAKLDANIKANVPAKTRNSAYTRLRDERVSEGNRERAFDHQRSVTSEGFEVRKPLTVWKEKQMVEPKVPGQDSTAGPNKAENSREHRPREVEDGEVRDEEDDWNEERLLYTGSPLVHMQEEAGLRHHADKYTGQPSGEALNHAQEEEDDDLGSSEDVSRLDEDMGPTISGEEDYELDEDEEKFDKRLGGFFS